MLYGWRYIAEVTVWTLACTWIIVWGGRAPRIVAWSLLAAEAAVGLLGRAAVYHRLHPASIAADAGVLAACLYARRWSRSRWLLIVIAGQILSLLTHLAKAVDATVGGWAYITLVEACGWLALAATIFGAVRERRR